MKKNILSLPRYALFTFKSTTQALKAEKVLQNNRAQFIIIPTLREITAGCGLSVKVDPSQWEVYSRLLQEHQVIVDKIYFVQKTDSGHQVEEWRPGSSGC